MVTRSSLAKRDTRKKLKEIGLGENVIVKNTGLMFGSALNKMMEYLNI